MGRRRFVIGKSNKTTERTKRKNHRRRRPNTRFAGAREKRERNYDTKYSISNCPDDPRRGRLTPRGTDAEGRWKFEPERKETREPKDSNQNRRRLQNSTRASVSGRLEPCEGRMDSFARLQVCEGAGRAHRRANSQKATETAFEGASEFCENPARALSRSE